jgi:predicted transcriptional regulator
MRVSVSIPDDVFEQCELLAEVLEISRSTLYAQALTEYIAHHHAHDGVTKRMNEAIEELGDGDSGFSIAAAHRTLRTGQW